MPETLINENWDYEPEKPSLLGICLFIFVLALIFL